MAYLVIVGVGDFCRYGVTLRIVEDHDVSAFDGTEAGHAVIFELWFFEIALCIDQWHRMLCEREVYGSLRNPGAVDSLVYPEAVTYKQRFFQT